MATQIKTDLVCMVQKNYLQKKAEQYRLHELEVRNANATAYLKSVQDRRRNFLAKICKAIAATVATIATVGTIYMVAMASSESETRYAIAGEQGNGIHYVYVTERECTVTKVTNTQVYVAYKGNEYSFYAYNTELKIGDTVFCRFTDNMEIYDTIEK